jgi:nicotinamidase-related amidase
MSATDQPHERAVQFLVNAQEDYMGRLAAGAKPPNGLHVGEAVVNRLRGNGGEDPFVDAARRILASGDVQVVLDEDWHNSNCDEFQVYGRHCVKGSDGARAVGAIEEHRFDDHVHVIRANSLNIASDERYHAVLKEVTDGVRPDRVRVGIMGVWTHTKVEILAIDLATLAPRFEKDAIGVCGPLCGSPDEADHLHALKKLRALGFRVFDEVGPYLEWLGVTPA